MKKTFQIFSIIIATIFFASSSFSFDLKGKTVTLFVPFGEGGGTDRLARLVAKNMETVLPGNPTVVVLNQPGGGSVKGSNKFYSSGAKDGTVVFMASSSTFNNQFFGSKKVKYDLNKLKVISLNPRGAILYANSQTTGAKGKNIVDDVKTLRSKSNLIVGGKTPAAGVLLDMTSMEILGINHKAVFGLSTGKKRKAFLRGETNINNDGTGVYRKKMKKGIADGSVAPLVAYGYEKKPGTLVRDPDYPNLPTVLEAYEQLNGKKLKGAALTAHIKLVSNKVTFSKAFFLQKGTSNKIVKTYIDAFKKLNSDPEFVKKYQKEMGPIKISYGKEAASMIKKGLKLDSSSKKWISNFLSTKHDAKL